MSKSQVGSAPGSLASNKELFARIISLRPSGSLTVIGLEQERFVTLLSEAAPIPRVLRLDFVGVNDAASAIDRILNDLADLVATLWPDWREAEPRFLSPRLILPWRKAAARFSSAGRRPRFPRLPRETEFGHLFSVLPELSLLAEIDPARAERAEPIIAVLEWCRRQGAPVIALLNDEPLHEAPWDRLLYDALRIETPPPEPAVSRLILPDADFASRGSAIERKMREALRATTDLTGLFEDEVTLQLGPLGPTPRVDLLWRHGRVVVEIDGPEHQRDPNYRADRHRDYELLVAGYLILRLTNDEVSLDLARSVEKVRRVVNLRRDSLEL